MRAIERAEVRLRSGSKRRRLGRAGWALCLAVAALCASPCGCRAVKRGAAVVAKEKPPAVSTPRAAKPKAGTGPSYALLKKTDDKRTADALLGRNSGRGSIGRVRFFRKERRVEVEGEVCLDQGILDYLAICPGSGKEYESLVTLKCRPSSLHAALLNIGARPGDMPEAFKGPRKAVMKRIDRPKPRGDRISITVRWKTGGPEESAPVEAWIIDRSTKEPAQPLTWVFTGSFFARVGRGRVAYAADVENVAVSMWYDEVCILNLAAKAGSPYRGESLGFEINANTVPAKGTKVWVSFHLPKRKGGKGK